MNPTIPADSIISGYLISALKEKLAKSKEAKEELKVQVSQKIETILGEQQ